MATSGILKPDDNCWRVEHADRVAFLVDGADYFHALREVLKKACSSILIIGWDINSQFKLEREPVSDGLPVEIGKLLNSLIERNQQLHIHVLDWDFSMIYAVDREWLPQYKQDWTRHPRLHFHLDAHHPVGACHHQKIVVIDDQVAFVGGLDITLGRWDTSDHRPDDQRRCEIDKVVPPPYHDVQMAVSGAVAVALGELARERWQIAVKEEIPPPANSADNAPWPDDLVADVENVMIGISRTYPVYKGQPEVREIERMVLDAVNAARKIIYIENQYFTAQKVVDALIQRLKEKNGPEIVLVLPQKTDGWLSQHSMDVLRERSLKRMQQADHYARLRTYYPDLPGLGKSCINVHSKIIIIDDELVRVGSSNLNNRSMGIDSECDLILEARGDEAVRAAIGDLRSRLLGEHLNVSAAEVVEALSEKGALIPAVESLRGGERTLKPLEFSVSKELDAIVPDSQIADPEQPFNGNQLARQFVDEETREPAKRTLITLLSVVVVVLALAVAWRWTPLGEWVNIGEIFRSVSDLRGTWLAPVIVSVVYIIGGLMVFPVTVMIVATGLAFGALYGFFYALLGVELSAIVTYMIGQYLGHDVVQKLSQRLIGRISRRLAQQGVFAIITLRIIPVAPFTVINLVAGASHIRLRDFALGTSLGMLPGILALTVFSDQVISAIQSPDATQFAILTLLAIAIVVGLWALSHWVLKRQKRRQRKTGKPEKLD